MARPVHKTGVFLTDGDMESIKEAMQPKMQIDLDAGMTVIEQPGPRGGLARLKEIALSRGLPELKPTFNYCLDGKEIVCLQEALPESS